MSDLRSRVSFRFSPDGYFAGCLAVNPHGRTQLESWALGQQGPVRRLRVPHECALDRSYALPLPGDQLLAMLWHGRQPQLVLLDPNGVRASRPAPPRCWLNAAPSGTGPALAMVDLPERRTEVYRVGGEATGTTGVIGTLLGRAPAPLRGPAPVTGDRVVFHIRRPDATAWPLLFDPATGTFRPLPLPARVRGALPVCAAGDTLLLAVTIDGRQQLALASPHQPGTLTPLPLEGLPGAVRPLALAPAGTAVLLQAREGIRYRLLRHEVATGQTTEITAPSGTSAPAAAWTDHGLWLPYTTTTVPAGPWWLPPGRHQLRPAEASAAGRTGGRGGQIDTLPGPAGPVEAVVYGDWRTSERVVLALHGGPAEHWPLSYEPVLQAMAAAGLCVVAPNPRGSTGYGRAHEEAIKNAWGGPDLADILAVGSHLTQERGPRLPRVRLYGTSYGAFLALLALAHQPPLWGGCVAVAPFLSGARLYPQAGPRVRRLLERLGGASVYTDDKGPRDLLHLAPQMRGPILLLHGERDPTIPVEHSRQLAAALTGGPQVALTYRELAGRGHAALTPTLDAPELVEVIRFLGGTHPDGAERPVDVPAVAGH